MRRHGSLWSPFVLLLSWVTGEWGDCSASCGQTGWQRRWVSCQQRSSTGQQQPQRSVHSKLCGDERPDGKQTCNRFPCPASWRAGPWTPVRAVKLGDYTGVTHFSYLWESLKMTSSSSCLSWLTSLGAGQAVLPGPSYISQSSSSSPSSSPPSSYSEICLPMHENKQNFAHRSSPMPDFLSWLCELIVLMVALQQPSKI